MLSIASAPSRLACFARFHTHGPQSSYELVERVISTRAPWASRRRLSRCATRQLKVASGNPELVAVPVVLQPFTIEPLNFFCAICRANFGFELPSW